MEIGQDPDRFWLLTPVQAGAEIKAAVAVQRRRHEEVAWAVWHAEALARSKELPTLNAMMGRPEPRQTDEEIEAILRGFI